MDNRDRWMCSTRSGGQRRGLEWELRVLATMNRSMIQIGHNCAVTCQHCQMEITFVKSAQLPHVIGLQCKGCGRRKIYAPDDVYVIPKAEQRAATAE
jgi:hypothetical protein